jgi:iron complex transport system substrate-binding protein
LSGWSARLAAVVLAGLLPSAGSHAATVRDDLGREITLPRQAQRIVTLSPHTTELVLAAGLGDRLVAIARGGANDPRLAGLPRIGGSGALDRETLLMLSPDLVVGWYSGNRPADLAWITRLDLPLFLSEPTDPTAIAAAIRALGKLGGTPDTAAAAAGHFLRSLQSPCSGLPPVDAYVEVWDQPAMSVGGRHWINPILRAAGYRNVFEGETMAVFAIATEARFARRDRVQISLIRRYDGSPDDRLADLLSRPGPGLAEAVGLLCAKRLQRGTTQPSPP